MRRTPEIYQLNLSTRAANALIRAGVNTVEQLEALGYEGLLSLRNVGVNTAYEISRKLQAWKRQQAESNRP